MHSDLVASDPAAVPVWPLAEGSDAAALPGGARRWIAATGFTAKAGRILQVPGDDGRLAGIVLGVGDDPFAAALLATELPAGTYRFAAPPPDPRLATLGFLLGRYRFERYRKGEAKAVRLVVPDGIDGEDVSRVAGAVGFTRDLVNTPTSDMGPAELEAAARALAESHGAVCVTTVGEELLAQNFPMIHAVGRAAAPANAPRLIDLRWGPEDAPKVTLVGKGVCFDSGGLDIKPASAMLLMKKDMGGAANVLGLACMVMEARLPVRLRVLVPAVENAISGDAFRPGDVLHSRKGITVEIGNTDAEGRLVLADALALADEESPELIVDMATLTGAARVALGPDLPALFTDDDQLAADLARHGAAEHDPVWRLPLWAPYRRMLDSKIADTNNVSSGGYAGAITAALFLARFVERARAWVHFDIYAWTPSAKPGRPEGGEAYAIRALYALLAARYPA
ncbi:MAG TPA: leucyl aminopeptidase family protein [Hyphomicrobiales bacterium]|nr:leucyl aminopeptidase family protein [Hyphomicrobiales bacterium]